MVIELLLLCFLTYTGLQAVSLFLFKGGWRIASVFVAVPGALILIYTVLGLLLGSNLFPLLLLFSGPILLLAIGLLFFFWKLHSTKPTKSSNN